MMIKQKERDKGNWFENKTIKPRELFVNTKRILSDAEYKPGLPGPTRKFTDFLRIIMFAVANTEPGFTYETSLQCRRRPGRKKCSGKILVYMETEESDIEWGCPICGDNGNITGEKTRRELSESR